MKAKEFDSNKKNLKNSRKVKVSKSIDISACVYKLFIISNPIKKSADNEQVLFKLHENILV